MKYFLVIFVCCFVFSIKADLHVGHLNHDNDCGIWLEENFTSTLGKLGCTIHIAQRIGDNGKRLWFHKQWLMTHYDFSDHVKSLLNLQEDSLFKTFSFGPGFANVWAINRNTKGTVHWSHSYRPNMTAFLIHTYRGWELEQRMIGEYNHFTTHHYRKNAYYRHRLLLRSLKYWTYFKISPFLSNEWFLRAKNSHKKKGVETAIQSGPYFENRFRVGFAIRINQFFTPQLWWQYRSVKQTPGQHPLWRRTYQLGISANIDY